MHTYDYDTAPSAQPRKDIAMQDNAMRATLRRYLDNNPDANADDLLFMFEQRCLSDPQNVVHVIDLRNYLKEGNNV